MSNAAISAAQPRIATARGAQRAKSSLFVGAIASALLGADLN
jgi:hypothetical protein